MGCFNASLTSVKCIIRMLAVLTLISGHKVCLGRIQFLSQTFFCKWMRIETRMRRPGDQPLYCSNAANIVQKGSVSGMILVKLEGRAGPPSARLACVEMRLSDQPKRRRFRFWIVQQRFSIVARVQNNHVVNLLSS